MVSAGTRPSENPHRRSWFIRAAFRAELLLDLEAELNGSTDCLAGAGAGRRDVWVIHVRGLITERELGEVVLHHVVDFALEDGAHACRQVRGRAAEFDFPLVLVTLVPEERLDLAGSNRIGEVACDDEPGIVER